MLQSKKKTTHRATLHLLPSWDALELILWDGREVVKADSIAIAGDASKRHLPDNLDESIQALFGSLQLPVSTPTSVVIPSLFTRLFEHPPELNGDELYFALLGEAERFYLFKKEEPVLDFQTLQSAQLDEANPELLNTLYSGFSLEPIEKLHDALQINQVNFSVIELNYLAALKGLIATGTIAELIDNQESWGFFFVSDHSLFLAEFKETQLVSLDERPISGGGQDAEKVINEIAHDFDQFIQERGHIDHLVMIHHARRIESEVLANKLAFSGEITLIEQTSNTLKSLKTLHKVYQSEGNFDPQTLGYPCSLEAMGGCFPADFDFVPTLNFIPKHYREAKQLDAAKDLGFKCVIGLNIVIAASLLLLWIGLQLWQLVIKAEASVIAERFKTIQTIENNERSNRLKLFVYQGLKRNVAVNNYLIDVATSLPKQLWVSSISGELAITPAELSIEGGTLLPEPVNTFSQTLKPDFPANQFQVLKLDLKQESDTQTYYQWAITTANQNKGKR